MKWKNAISYHLLSKVGLMVGLSGSDASIKKTLSEVYKSVSEFRNVTAFAILTPEAYDENRETLNEYGVICLSRKIEEIPFTLLEISEMSIR